MNELLTEKPTQAPVIRCAIYTRKSTEEGLDMDFNSLDAQRESAEAFIASQREQGWTVIPEHFDDGGFSGGNTERPALKRLVDAIEAGRVDCVVVYKVDRLSRSLLDFSKIMDTFDSYGVSFVSVTQQFNTTHSMGRLTLNILLSFAQFEREIIGERIRDKIAAQRRRGKWSGGTPVLGYDVDRSGPSPKLVVNGDERGIVRHIFELYFEKQALMPVAEELNRRGWHGKVWTTRRGIEKGGRPFDKCSVHKLLTNVLYVGKLRHKENVYEGEHDAIVDEEMFREVGELLRKNGRGHGNAMRDKYGACLKGLIYCSDCQKVMVHNNTRRGSKVYRYYTCLTVIKRGRKHCETPALPAADVESEVVDQIRCIASDEGLRREILSESLTRQKAEVEELELTKVQHGRQLKRAAEEIRTISLDNVGSISSDATARLADLHEKVSTLEYSIAETERALVAHHASAVSEAEVIRAMSNFDNVWHSLSSHEQREVMALLIERIDFDRSDGTIEIKLHATAIKSLAETATDDEGGESQ